MMCRIIWRGKRTPPYWRRGEGVGALASSPIGRRSFLPDVIQCPSGRSKLSRPTYFWISSVAGGLKHKLSESLLDRPATPCYTIPSHYLVVSTWELFMPMPYENR